MRIVLVQLSIIVITYFMKVNVIMHNSRSIKSKEHEQFNNIYIKSHYQ